MSTVKTELFNNAGMTHSYHRIFSVQLVEHKHILWLVDGLLVFVALLGGLWLGAQRSGWLFSTELIWAYTPWFVGMMFLYFFMATANDVYRPKIATDFLATTIALIKTLASIFVIYLLIYALVPYPFTLPRHFTGFFALLALLLLLGWRRLYGLVFVMPAFQRRAIVVGAGWAGKTIVKTLNDFARPYFRVIGFVDDDPAKHQEIMDGAPVIGPTNSLFKLALQHNATDIVLAITHDVPGDILANLLICYEQGLRVSTMPDLYERLTDRIPVEHVGDNWFVVLPFDGQGQNLSYRVVKRCLDVLIALLGLSIFSFLLPFLAIAVVLDSPGPVFYRQKRVGRGGQIFELIKLRSMVMDAEEDGQAKWAEKYDKRVTRVGRFLRRTRLDEVPQLFNVLRGDMSLVGPRPERPEFVIDLQQQIPFYRTRLTVKPGLTGWAQVYYDYGRSITDALEKLRYDLYYIKHQSIQLDVIILFKTVGIILFFKGV